jgi:hypothetical protein
MICPECGHDAVVTRNIRYPNGSMRRPSGYQPLKIDAIVLPMNLAP